VQGQYFSLTGTVNERCRDVGTRRLYVTTYKLEITSVL